MGKHFYTVRDCLLRKISCKERKVKNAKGRKAW